MNRIEINGVELEYEVTGSGPPILLISTGPIANSFLPLFSEKRLTERYQLIRYRQREIDPDGDSPSAVSFNQHADDAAGLLRHLGVSSAHIAGHSTGACIALQMALTHSAVVESLVLLEPPLLAAPGAAAFFEKVGPALATYQGGDPAGAMRHFLSVVCSLDWLECRSVIESNVPGGADAAVANAHNFFASYLPALSSWQFGPDEAKRISQPVLSVVGSETEPLFVDSHQLIRAWLPQAEECEVEGAAHLLHMQRPKQVVKGVEHFLAEHSLVRQR